MSKRSSHSHECVLDVNGPVCSLLFCPFVCFNSVYSRLTLKVVFLSWVFDSDVTSCGFLFISFLRLVFFFFCCCFWLLHWRFSVLSYRYALIMIVVSFYVEVYIKPKWSLFDLFIHVLGATSATILLFCWCHQGLVGYWIMLTN